MVIKAVYEAFACLFVKYFDEIFVTPPGLGKNFNPSAMLQLPNSTKEEVPARGKLSSPATASLFALFPKLLAWAIAGNKKLNQPSLAVSAISVVRAGCSMKRQSELLTEKHTEKCLAPCTLTCRDWPHQAAVGALTVLLGTSPLLFLQPLHGSSG